MDLERLSYQLKLFHHVEVGVELDNNTSHAHSEMTRVLIHDVLEPDKRSTHGIGRSVEHTVREAEFRSILDHAHFCVSTCLVLHRVHRDGLELSPSYRENDRILGLKHVRIPAMLLDFHAQEGEIILMLPKTA